MPVTATTDLPAADIATLDNGVEDEVTANLGTTTDYGEYEVDYKKSSSSTWLDGTTVAHTNTSPTVIGLEDGEEYDFRVRSKTEHVTQVFTATETIITKFPSPSMTSVDAVRATEADLSWNDDSDAEDGFRVQRRKEYGAGWADWRTVADLAPNTVTYTDDDVIPGETYEWRIEAYTEDSTATGGVATATASSSGKTRHRRSSDGWTVEVDHPSGRTLRPKLYDDVRWVPVVMGLPRVQIPVPRSGGKWTSVNFEGATARVYRRGVEIPVDGVETVRTRPDHVVLEGRAGTELDRHYEAFVQNEEVHARVNSIIANETSYAADVDDPASETQNNTQMQSASTTSDFDGLTTVADDVPLEVANGRVRTLQSCFFREGENPDREFDPSYVMDEPDLSGGDARGIYNSNSYLEWDFTPQYRIPAANVQVSWREYGSDSDIQSFRLLLDGNEICYHPGGATLDLGPTWRHLPDVFNGSGYTGGDLQPGTTYTLRLEAMDSNGGSLHLDGVAVSDDRYSYFWDDDNGGSQGYLDGPEEMPGAVDVAMDATSSAFNIVALQAVASLNDTSGGQAVHLSNDGGASWKTGANTDDFSASFTAAGSQARVKFTLSRYGSRTGQTPKKGFKGQELDSFTLYGDLEDTPVVDRRRVRGSIKDVLNELAGYGNSTWEFRLVDGTPTVVWTQPGTRSDSVGSDVLDFDLEKTVEGSYDRIIAEGGALRELEEEFTASHDVAVALDRSNLVVNRETVQETDGSVTYEYGVDYELDHGSGDIIALSGGGMADGAAYKVTYEWKPKAAYPEDPVDGETKHLDIPSLATGRECQQAALYAYERVKEPLHTGSVSLPEPDPSLSLVEDLTVEGVPHDGAYIPRETSQRPDGLDLEVGTRERLDDVINQVQNRLGSLSERS